MCIEQYKTLMREIKDLNKGRYYNVKMSILPNLTSGSNFNENLSRHFLVDTDKPDLKFTWKCKEQEIVETILKIKNKIGWRTQSDI